MLICGVKNDTNKLIYKTEIDSDLGNKFMDTKEEGKGRETFGIWD